VRLRTRIWWALLYAWEPVALLARECWILASFVEGRRDERCAEVFRAVMNFPDSRFVEWALLKRRAA
jgi:hypothetical protein